MDASGAAVDDTQTVDVNSTDSLTGCTGFTGDYTKIEIRDALGNVVAGLGITECEIYDPVGSYLDSGTYYIYIEKPGATNFVFCGKLKVT